MTLDKEYFKKIKKIFVEGPGSRLSAKGPTLNRPAGKNRRPQNTITPLLLAAAAPRPASTARPAVPRGPPQRAPPPRARPLQPPLLVAPGHRRGRLLRARTPRRWPQRWLRRRVEPAEHDQVRIRLPRPASHLRSAPVLTELHRCFSSEGKAEDAMVARLEKHTGPVSRAGLAS